MANDRIALDRNKPEVLRELEHLDQVLNKLNRAIGDMSGQKQTLSDTLVEYRKQLIEENKFDEDQPLDAFDHEMFAREENYKAVLRRINEIQDLLDSPYFGKIAFEEAGNKDEIYVGKYGFLDEKNYEPLIVDWRAPVATLFYHGGLGEAQYKTPKGKVTADIQGRRQFIIKDGYLKGMFDSEREVRDEILQYVLSSSAGEKLKDIVMTIQQEQDEIIRFHPKGVAVVNGIAGSGKTTIALHRIAWLLYNHREKLENKVLILGPNNIFMEYISHVLPTLGETGVRQNTMFDFVLDLLGPLPEVLPQEDFLEAVLAGDEELYEVAGYKRSSAWLKDLEKAAASIQKNLYAPRTFEFMGEVLMTEEEMDTILNQDFAYMPIKPRGLRLKRVLINRLKDLRNRKVAEINQRYKKTAKRLALGESLPDQSRRDQIRAFLAEVIAFRREFAFLGQGDIAGLYAAHNPYRVLLHEDLIPMLYFKHLLEGVKLPYPVKYLVVDEAQDYSPSNLSVIRTITGCDDATIVGDENQQLISWPGESFTNLTGIYPKVTEFLLHRSYRSTDEIVQYADQFRVGPASNSLRSGEPVIIKTVSQKDLVQEIKAQYEHMRASGMESIAILTRNLDRAQALDAALRDEIYYKFIRTGDGIYTTQTLLLSSFLAKGLEFDGVILVDHEPDKSKPDLVKYIMATRALHRLTVIELA